ncbi:MAG: DUF3341 domain-containing protein [Acidobacteria bacterium]|nr:MAG: DUF3341 domain-containing protein [Acidobacteriota bacterium]
MAATRFPTPTYGLLAEFDAPQALIAALEAVREKGYRKLDAFTPFPIPKVSELVVDHRKSKVPLIVLCGGLLGAATALAMQTWISVVDYPLNVGNRPLFSWPAFIPVTFELLVLFAAFSAVFGMFILNGLPRPHHPVFNVERFERATTDRYFLLIEAADPNFDRERTRELLASLGASEVNDVDW